MNAHNDVKRPSDPSLDPWLALAAVHLRFAARVDLLIARWLEGCATNAEAAQRLFKTDRKPSREFGTGGRQSQALYVLSSSHCDEHP